MIIEMFAADVNIAEEKLSIQMLRLDRGKITLTSSKLKGPWEGKKIEERNVSQVTDACMCVFQDG